MSGKKRKQEFKSDDITIDITTSDTTTTNNDKILKKKDIKDVNYDDNNNYIRYSIQPKPLHQHHKYLKIITWNVNGFTALVNKNLKVLTNLIDNYQPDIICLQETKIQDSLISSYQHLFENYVSYWNCSTVKKGKVKYVIITLINTVSSLKETYLLSILLSSL